MRTAGIAPEARRGIARVLIAEPPSSKRGYVDVVRFLCPRGASLTHHHNYGGNALGTCLWGSLNFVDKSGDYPATAEALIDAGAKVPEKAFSSDAVQAILRQHGAA